MVDPAHSLFASLDEAPADPILGVAVSYKADPHPDKVDLGVGAYRTEEGKPYVFQVVRHVEQQLTNELLNLSINKEYLPIDGIPELKILTQRLLFGDCEAVNGERICSAQSISGTGALRVLANFIAIYLDTPKLIYLSKPTWTTHHRIFSSEGFSIREYPYWNTDSKTIDIHRLLSTLENAPTKSIVLLHACAHNPTGLDPTLNDWLAIVEVIQRKQLIPFLDTAYQGFASGDLEKDAGTVRLFLQSGMEMFVAQSFAKNFGLYGERIGMVHMVCSSNSIAKVVLSNLKVVIRSMYSNPPKHGGQIVQRILSDAKLKADWQNELKNVAGRIVTMRQLLYEALIFLNTPGNWDHLQKQQGMFSFTGLSPDQCDRMTRHWHIYMLKNGRISLSGINMKNFDYVAKAIDDCVRTIPYEDSRI